MNRSVLVVLLLLASPSAHAEDEVVSPADAVVSPVAAAEAAAARGDWSQAAQDFERAALDSEDGALWYRLAVARALDGDAAGAAVAFRRARDLEPQIPGIAERIAAAEARAAYDAAQAHDPPGFFTDLDVRADARLEALRRDDLLYATRAAVGLPAGADTVADSLDHRLRGEAERAALAAVQAVAEAPLDLDAYLTAADALRLAADLDAARYFVDLYVTLGGDPSEAASIRDALERAADSAHAP